jgi:hypothetical protein
VHCLIRPFHKIHGSYKFLFPNPELASDLLSFDDSQIDTAVKKEVIENISQVSRVMALSSPDIRHSTYAIVGHEKHVPDLQTRVFKKTQPPLLAFDWHCI